MLNEKERLRLEELREEHALVLRVIRSLEKLRELRGQEAGKRAAAAKPRPSHHAVKSSEN